MKITFILLTIIICGSGAYAQNYPATGNVNKPLIILSDTARYQLVSMNQTGLLVVKLDRFSGKSYFFDTTNGRRRWYPLEVRGGLPASSTNTTPKYQIYSEADDFNFLTNNETGQSWILYGRTWEPILD